jgi:hypothetical protein
MSCIVDSQDEEFQLRDKIDRTPIFRLLEPTLYTPSQKFVLFNVHLWFDESGRDLAAIKNSLKKFIPPAQLADWSFLKQSIRRFFRNITGIILSERN